MFYFADGRFTRALASLRRARELDPLSLFIAVTAVWPLPNLGRYNEAVDELASLSRTHPDVADIHEYLHELRAEVHLQNGMPDQAVAEFQQGFRAATLCGGDRKKLAALADAYTRSGMRGYWQKQLELAREKYRIDLDLAGRQSPARYVSSYYIAALHARLGQKDEAFAILERCVRSRDESLLWLKAESLRNNSPWEALRSDPRFPALLARIGFEP
jgi:tetratricopeptide (TPR) repeat protein